MASLLKPSSSGSLSNMAPDPTATNVSASAAVSKSQNQSVTQPVRPTQPIPKKSALIKTDRPRPHACLICTRAFARLEHLRRHERSHTNEKPFQCAACGRCFARRDLVLRHQQKLHAGLINNTPPPSHISQNPNNGSDANPQSNPNEATTRKGKIYNSNIIEHKNNTDKIKPLPGQDSLPPAIPKQKKRAYNSQKSKVKSASDSSTSKPTIKKPRNSSTSPNNEPNNKVPSSTFFDKPKGISGNNGSSTLLSSATLGVVSQTNSPDTKLASSDPLVAGTAMAISDSLFSDQAAIRSNSIGNSNEVVSSNIVKDKPKVTTPPSSQNQRQNNNNRAHHHRHASFSAASAISYTLPTEAKVIHDQESIPPAPHQVEFSTPQLAAEVPIIFPFLFDPLDEDYNGQNSDPKNVEPISWNAAYTNQTNNNMQLFNGNSNDALHDSLSSTPQDLFANNNNNQLGANRNNSNSNSPSPFMSLFGNFNNSSLGNNSTAYHPNSLFNNSAQHNSANDKSFAAALNANFQNNNGYFANHQGMSSNNFNPLHSGSLTPFGGVFSFHDYLHVGGVGGAAGFDEYDRDDAIQVPLPNSQQNHASSISSATTLKKSESKSSTSSIPILQSQNSNDNSVNFYNGKNRGDHPQQQPALDDWLSEFIKTPPSDMNIDINYVGFDHHHHNDNVHPHIQQPQHLQQHVQAHQPGSFSHPTPGLYSPRNHGSLTSAGDIMSLFTDRQLDLFQQELLHQQFENSTNNHLLSSHKHQEQDLTSSNHSIQKNNGNALVNMAAFNMTPSNSTNSSTSPTSTASSTSNNNHNTNKLSKLYSAFDLHNTSSNNSNTSSSFSPGIVLSNNISSSGHKITPTGILATSLGGSGSRSNTVNIDFDLFNKDIRHHILSKNGLQESQFPSIGELNSYIYLYWKEFDTYFPFIHLPSLESNINNIPLLLAIAAIGALYSFHSSNSLLLFNVSKKYIHHFLELSKQQQKAANNHNSTKYEEFNDEIPLWLVQCLTLNMFLGIFNNDESLNESVARQLNSLIYLLKKCNLHLPLENFLSPPSIFENVDSNDVKGKAGKNTTPATLKNNFDYFVLAQSRIRTVHTILLVSILFDSLIGVPIILKSKDIKCGSPCENESLWNATSYTHWFLILMENHIIIDSKFVLVQLSNGENFKDLVNALENHNYMDLISKKVGLRTLLSLLMYIQETIYEQRIATREEEMLNLAEENKFKNKQKNLTKENGNDKKNVIKDSSFVKSTRVVTSQAEELRIAMKWRMHNRSVLESLIKYWELLFIKNNGVLIPNNSNLELINRSPILKLILPLLSFAKIRLCLSMTPILQRVWAKDWAGMNEQLQLIEHDSEALKESSRYALNIIELWIDLISVHNDAEKTSRKTPIFFLTCTFTAILFLSEYLYAIETLANDVSNEISIASSHNSDLNNKNLQRKRNVLTAADTALFIRVSNILKKVSVTLAPDNDNPQTRTYAEFLKIQAKGALNFDSAAINDFQNGSAGDHDSFEKLFNFIRHSRLSSKCLYLGIRILADAPIWPAAVLFAEALQARAVSISNNILVNNNTKNTPSSID